MMLRQGTCNRCGQCCGAEGSPNQANPWPKNWFEHHRNWKFEDFESEWAYAPLFGVGRGNAGKPVKGREHGFTTVPCPGGQPRRFHWTWQDGRPCKDTSQAHDGSEHSLECPFLMDDTGDGSRPCGLVDTVREDAYIQVCYPEGPETFHNQESVDQWMSDHPLCGYTWEQE